VQLKISLPPELVGLLDEARGDVSRSIFVRRALEGRLAGVGGALPPIPPLETDQALALARATQDFAVDAAQASTARLRGADPPATTSAQAKARVVPRPKRGGK
jgi:hypothetical protein